MNMGLFDIFSRKKQEEPGLRQEFDALKKDFAKMRQEVSVINGNLTALEQNVRLISEKGEDSRLMHSIRELQAKMRDLLAFARLSLQNHDEIQKMKAGKTAEIQKISASPKEKRVLASMEDLSPREREVISVLLASEIPLSNEEIAKQLGVSPITVKGHINSIKKRQEGLIIDEERGRNKKQYKIDRTFKLKVLDGQN